MAADNCESWQRFLFSFCEGATLAMIYLAVEVLSASSDQPFDWGNNPILKYFPDVAGWLNGLPTSQLFMSLLVLALILQFLQSVSRFFNLLTVKYFAARCQTLVMTRIHRQVLSWNFACGSNYKVGDLTDHCIQGPKALCVQVEKTCELVLGLLLSVTYLTVLVQLSSWLLMQRCASVSSCILAKAATARHSCWWQSNC